MVTGGLEVTRRGNDRLSAGTSIKARPLPRRLGLVQALRYPAVRAVSPAAR